MRNNLYYAYFLLIYYYELCDSYFQRWWPSFLNSWYTSVILFTSRGRVCLPSSWICISINWFWLIESDRKDAAAQDAGTLTSFTFLFLGTQPPYCEKLMPHEDSTWRRTGVLWLAGPAGLWAITRAIFHPVKELIQSRPQITATLVMIMGSRGTH